MPYPKKIISGGQTGVDRAALDVAFELGFPVEDGARRTEAEDGPIDPRYPLRETHSLDYRVRNGKEREGSGRNTVLTWGPATAEQP